MLRFSWFSMMREEENRVFSKEQTVDCVLYGTYFAMSTSILFSIGTNIIKFVNLCLFDFGCSARLEN